jgi:putative two-component system response regulator
MRQAQETILVVDDEEGIRRLLIHKMKNCGYRCIEAGNAFEATDLLKINEVGLVILDMKMPGKTGLELLTEIRAKYPKTSVIMATAVSDTGTVIDCMKHGAYDYLTKPFDLAEVAMSIERALQKRRLELELSEYHENLQTMVDEQAQKIRESFLNSITALAVALDAKDSYTNGHSERVADISVRIGKELNLAEKSIEQIRVAGLVHDIGKIGVPEAILNKPGELTEDENRQIQAHCEIGERILKPIVDDGEVLKMVRHHHERYDGRGYPDMLKGTNIPIGARIITISDSYDAMTSDRPYRKAMRIENVAAEIAKKKLTQFDPEIADVFIGVVMTNGAMTKSRRD